MTLQQLRQVIATADAGSMNEAAKQLFVSQPSLSEMVKELEREIDIVLFIRSNRGIRLTPEGSGFLGYARQVVEQYELLEDRYLEKHRKKKFSVSTQHYTFAVKAFVEMVKKVGMEEYEFAIHETKTHDVIQSVKHYKSELGILYLNDMNEKVLRKLFAENELEFVELFQCETYVYLWSSHPLAKKSIIAMKDLESYPCIAFTQGENNSFYLAEEMKSTYEYKQIIQVDDRATALNLMLGLHGYTLCSGIICNELNGDEQVAIPLLESETMSIGYVHRLHHRLSNLAQLYIEEVVKYRDSVL
ncbi:MAG: LysR family transcriptional regulator [Eubacteriales bacterium]